MIDFVFIYSGRHLNQIHGPQPTLRVHQTSVNPGFGAKTPRPEDGDGRKPAKEVSGCNFPEKMA